MSVENLVHFIEKRCKELHISPRAASLKTGNNAYFIRNIKRNNTLPRVDKLQSLADVLDVPFSLLVDYLSYEGEGEPDFSEIPDKRKSFIQAPDDVLVIPEYSPKDCANAQSFSSIEVVSREWRMPKSFLEGNLSDCRHLAIVTVNGDSMAPDYKPSEKLLIDIDQRYTDDSVYYISTKSTGMKLKQVQQLLENDGGKPRYRISSRKSTYADEVLPSDDINFLGRVVAKWTWR